MGALRQVRRHRVSGRSGRLPHCVPPVRRDGPASVHEPGAQPWNPKSRGWTPGQFPCARIGGVRKPSARDNRRSTPGRDNGRVTITITPRYRGPATSGNGGYTAGVLATKSGLEPVGTSAESSAHTSVRLRTPPPLDTPMDLDIIAGSALLRCGDVVVAEATKRPLTINAVPRVSYGDALAASASYAGLVRHPFPTCFVCGTEREPGDGLRLFPGRVAPGHTACAWVPDPSIADADGCVPAEMLWAALDCPGGWTAEIEGRPMVLGTMTARLDRLPTVGERCVVVGALLGADGRRADTATTAYGADGAVLGVAHAVWIEIDADAFNRTFGPRV